MHGYRLKIFAKSLKKKGKNKHEKHGKKKNDTVYENIARTRNVGKILLYTGYLTRQSNEIFSVLFY